VRSYRFRHGRHNYVLVDTPGFDDSTMSNDDITKKLVEWLESSYRRGQRLNGIVYIHDITKTRMQGSAYHNIEMFRNLCGDGALGNVILATSFWDLVEPSLGKRRERELVDSKAFWANMVAKGSRVVRLTSCRSDCLKLLEQIAGNSKCDLLVQQELVTENRAIEDTTLGRQTMNAEIERVDIELRRAREEERERWKVKVEERDKWQKKELKTIKSEHESRIRELREAQKGAQSNFEREMRELRESQKRAKSNLEQEMREGNGPPTGPRAVLYSLAAFWTLLITALLGNVISEATGGTPSQINYCMFVAVVSWLVLTIGLFGTCAGSNHPAVFIVADSFAVLFTFIAAVVLSAKLGVHSCFNYV
jgi:hypothetical protein